MTPITAVNELPIHGGFVAAVRLSPEGLQLAQPATLTISPATTPHVVGTETGFLASASGANFHLYPVDTKGVLKFELSHFSTPGVAGASAADINAQTANPPLGAIAQLEQEIGALTSQVAAGSLSSGSYAARLDALLNGFRSVLDAEVTAASAPTASYDTVSRALDDLLAWGRLYELWGGVEEVPGFGSLFARMVKAVDALAQRLLRSCFDGHNVAGGLRSLELSRTLTLLGAAEASLADADAAAVRCLHFQLDFDVSQKVIGVGIAIADIATHLRADGIPVAVFDGGSGPLTYVSFDEHPRPDGCGDGTPTISATTRVDAPVVTYGISGLEVQPDGSLSDFFLEMNPGQASEALTVTCPFGNPGSGTFHIYNQVWELLHGDEAIEGFDSNHKPRSEYSISGWSIAEGAKFASKTYSKSNSAPAELAQSLSDTVTLLLQHTPQGSYP